MQTNFYTLGDLAQSFTKENKNTNKISNESVENSFDNYLLLSSNATQATKAAMSLVGNLETKDKIQDKNEMETNFYTLEDLDQNSTKENKVSNAKKSSLNHLYYRDDGNEELSVTQKLSNQFVDQLIQTDLTEEEIRKACINFDIALLVILPIRMEMARTGLQPDDPRFDMDLAWKNFNEKMKDASISTQIKLLEAMADIIESPNSIQRGYENGVKQSEEDYKAAKKNAINAIQGLIQNLTNQEKANNELSSNANSQISSQNDFLHFKFQIKANNQQKDNALLDEVLKEV